MSVTDFVVKSRLWVPDRFRSKFAVYLIILASITLDNLNVAGALTVSNSIAEAFNASTVTVSWVLSAYALTLGSFIIIFGKLADIVGVHTVFVCGLGSMSIFSLLSAAVPGSVIAVIVFRAFQGICGAALLPCGYALTAHYFQGKALERAIKGLAVVLTASFGFGCVLGGAFSLTSIGYQGFFYFTFGAAVLGTVLLYFLIIPVEKTEEHKNLKVRNLDFVGVALLVIGLLLIIFALTEAGHTWNSPKVYVTLPIGIVLIIVLILFENLYLETYQAKHKNKKTMTVCSTSTGGYDEEKSKQGERETTETEPSVYSTSGDWRMDVDILFPRQLSKLTNFFPLLAGVFLCYFVFIGILSGFIQYSIYIHGDSPLIAALKVMPVSIGLCIGSLIYSQSFPEKFGTKNVMIFSSVVFLGATIWASRTDYKVTNDFWIFQCFSLFLMGYSCNLFFMVYLNSILSETPLHLQGLVSGIFQTSGQIGVAISNSIVSTILGPLEVNTSDPHQKEELYKKFHNSFYASVAAAALFFLAMFLIKNKKKPEGEEPAKKDKGVHLELDGSA